MTREAKIGMLTGLGVIVLIGVLLSEYLGDKNTAPATAAGATGQMAPLPVGSDYRHQLMSPIGVPTPAGGGQRTQLAGGGEVVSTIATSNSGGLPPAMLAVDTTISGPRMSDPVSPVAAGPSLMDPRSDGGPPILTLSDTVQVKATDASVRGASAVPVTTYTIVAGDTLAKIARKYYTSAKPADVQRIVAANPAILKDATTMLVVGKKLVIPDVPAPTPAPVAVAPVAPPAPKTDPGVIPLPGGTGTDLAARGVIQPPTTIAQVTAPKADAPKAEAPKPATYVVQSGDTLEKIARKIAPTKIPDTVQKLTSLNAIKDPTRLQVGQTLKLPA